MNISTLCLESIRSAAAASVLAPRRRFSRCVALLATCVLPLGLATAAAASSPTAPVKPAAAASTKAPPPAATIPSLALFDATAEVIKANAKWSKGERENWEKAAALTRSEVATLRTTDGARLAINALLAAQPPALGHLYCADEQEYWTLSSVFSGNLAGSRLPHIGAWFTRRGRRWFVRNVYADSPAERAGLLRGDEIISVEGEPFTPVKAFRDQRPGTKLTLSIRRRPGEPVQTLTAAAEVESWQETLKRHISKGQWTVSLGGKNVAYLPLPLTGHAEIRRTIAQAVSAMATPKGQSAQKVDALVIDLRDDYGGGDLTAFEPFFDTPTPKAHPELGPTAALYSQPLVALINGGTSGGKEHLAWLLQKTKRAVLVGEATAGAASPGRPFEIAVPGWLLYLTSEPAAVAASHAPTASIIPDETVDASLMYAAGDDPQLHRALELAAAVARAAH